MTLFLVLEVASLSRQKKKDLNKNLKKRKRCMVERYPSEKKTGELVDLGRKLRRTRPRPISTTYQTESECSDL